MQRAGFLRQHEHAPNPQEIEYDVSEFRKGELPRSRQSEEHHCRAEADNFCALGGYGVGLSSC